jgi:hypothetical protein
MFKVKVSSKFRAVLATKLKGTVDAKFVQDMQTEVVDGEIKRMIAAGVSPVDSYDGGRRFPGYKDPKKYPGKKKAKRPVSLYLSGVMLSFYRAVRISGTRISIGIPTSAPENVKVRAVANNVGTVSESGREAIPARRFIPLKGESYRISVMRKIKNLYARRIKAILSSK